MSPPTGPRSDRATANRTTRGGGVQKARRGGSPRVDRDGDVSMGAIAGRAMRSASRGGRGGMVSNDPRMKAKLDARVSVRQKRLTDRLSSESRLIPNATIFKILGLKNSKAAANADGGQNSLIRFIERKATNISERQGTKKIVVVKKSMLVGDYFYLMVNNDVAEEVMKINGYNHAGAPITIEKSEEPWPGTTPTKPMISKHAQNTKEKFTAVIASRYKAEAKLLNLSFLAQDPILNNMGMFNELRLAEKAFKGLLFVAAQTFESASVKKDAVQLITLAGNGLDNIAPVFIVAEQFPGILALDLSNNAIDKLCKLKQWRHCFHDLQEIHLAGNPIVEQEPDYETRLLEWFPKLLRVNNKQLRTAEEAELLLKAKTPTPIPQVGSNFRDVNGFGENFLRDFFPLFDSDRPALAVKWYDETSVFSVAVVPKSCKGSIVAILPWKQYLKINRNLHLSSHPRSSEHQRRVFRGIPLIADAWRFLPATQHPSIEHSDWLVDSHVVHGVANPTGSNDVVDGLVITVNGHFEELDLATKKVGKRSFTRHFILGPSQPARKNPIRVVSDQLTIRGFQQAQANETENPPIALALTDELRRKMMQELSERTGMTLQYSEMCLAGPKSNWNMHLAITSFEELKTSLPSEAFLSPAGPA